MRLKERLNRVQSVRFFRWSRKSYAIFCSLKKCITISVLRREIVDCSQKKSNILPETITDTIIAELLQQCQFSRLRWDNYAINFEDYLPIEDQQEDILYQQSECEGICLKRQHSLIFCL